jgi:hypothetical protein
LRRLADSSKTSATNSSPALDRWNQLVDRAAAAAGTWGLTDDEFGRAGVRVKAVFSGPSYPNLFESLDKLWPAGSPPTSASVLSPFFDPPEAPNVPAQKLWGLVRQRGEATIEFYVSAEDVQGEDAVFLHAPKSLLDAQPPGRPSVDTEFYRVRLDQGRSLHAKGVWLWDDRWSVYSIGSSNFTSAGTGLAKAPNAEANLVYVVDANREPGAERMLEAAFPEYESVDLDGDVRWQPFLEEGMDAAEEVLLPAAFGEAVYNRDDKNRATVTLSLAGEPPPGWELISDGDEQPFFGDTLWRELKRPESCEREWAAPRPPSGFWVHWAGSGGRAWWPVNVLSGSALPPPEELAELPLEVLIDILSSSRPLHRVLQDYLRRRKREMGKGDTPPVVDPHKRVDTSLFLLQRTRRVSWAFNALRERLERPAATPEVLRWRLHGPVGVMAFVRALVREAQSSQESAFLIAELALELTRARPVEAPGCVPPKEHRTQIRDVIRQLKNLIPARTADEPANLRDYVDSIFAAVPG